MKVLALEPYHVLSHASFLEGYARRSRHEVEIWSLPARKWKWRMRGSAYHFADLARRPGGLAPDAVLASDFLNLCEWRALAPPRFGSAPSLLYFHENQVTYPLGELAPRDFHYGWINLSSALAADRILFNSSFHREEFIRAVAGVLARMPDHVPEGIPERIRERSGVFPVGIDFEPHRQALARRPAVREGPPVLLWNHRWEHDKGPDLLAGALIELHRGKVPFRVVICGQTGIAGNMTLGDGARLGAKTGMIHVVPPGATFCGSPAVPFIQHHRMVASLQRLARERRKGKNND